MRVVVIGAGIGGLTAAAALARAGLDVTVLEAHIYPGGCAGTFYHQGYRFDAGATMAGGFYPAGPMERVAQAAGISAWPAQAAETAMAVHLPESSPLYLHGGESRWEERRTAFGREADDFFRWQERTAEALWELALCLPPWPPQSPTAGFALAQKGISWLAKDWAHRSALGLLADAFRSVAAHLRGAPKKLRLFIDAQLLISAQTTSPHANALYGASALDLPRRGVVHLEGGMGAIAHTLAQAIISNGGRVYYRQEVKKVLFENRRPSVVITRRGERFPAELVILNLPAGNILPLLETGGQALRRLPEIPRDGWGAFVVYAGLEGTKVPPNCPLHHQVVLDEPLGEGKSLFLSLSPPWDASRAPVGHRAVTLSTHTALEPWWRLYEADRPAYADRKAEYSDRLLAAAEVAIPGLKSSSRLVLTGTPVTFQRFTRRKAGWVGGFPQTTLVRSIGPLLAQGLWMVGDSIFPGQSVPAVALGGLRVAEGVLNEFRSYSQRTVPKKTVYRYKRAVG